METSLVTSTSNTTLADITEIRFQDKVLGHLHFLQCEQIANICMKKSTKHEGQIQNNMKVTPEVKTDNRSRYQTLITAYREEIKSFTSGSETSALFIETLTCFHKLWIV